MSLSLLSTAALWNLTVLFDMVWSQLSLLAKHVVLSVWEEPGWFLLVPGNEAGGAGLLVICDKASPGAIQEACGGKCGDGAQLTFVNKVNEIANLLDILPESVKKLKDANLTLP